MRYVAAYRQKAFYCLTKGDIIMPKLYLVLTRTNTNLAKAIRFFTKRSYNHVSIALDDRLDRLYSFGRRRPRNPFFAGFVREDILTGFYHYFNDTTCIIYELSVSELQWSRLQGYLTPFLSDPMRYKFNFIGLILCGLSIPFSPKNTYFCSQFISEALEQSGIYSFGKDCRLIQPASFMNLPNAKVIYRGKIVSYHPAAPLSAKEPRVAAQSLTERC